MDWSSKLILNEIYIMLLFNSNHNLSQFLIPEYSIYIIVVSYLAWNELTGVSVNVTFNMDSKSDGQNKE
jgi:hypothetical protein